MRMAEVMGSTALNASTPITGISDRRISSVA